MNESSRPKFEVIRTPLRKRIETDDLLEFAHQADLFPRPKKGLLVFVYFPDVTEQEFRTVLMYSKPGQVLELRSAPRFDIGSLDRQIAFQLFSEQGSTYIDLTSSSSSMGLSCQDTLLDSLRSYLKNSPLSAERPVMILMNSADSSSVSKPIRRMISSVLPEFTSLFEVPRFTKEEAKAKSAS